MKMKKLMAVVAVAALPLGIFVGQAAAETATDTIDVYAGLAPVMELSCTDVNFGVWRVPATDRIDVNTITLADDNGTTVGGSGETAGIALSSNYEVPAAGICTVTGSAATDDTEGAASISATTGTMVTAGAAGGNPFATALAGPGTAINNMDYTLAVSDSTPVITSGEASFKVTGVLTIPALVLSSNYGSYKSTDSHTVTFADAQ